MRNLRFILKVLRFQPEWWAVYKLGQKKDEFASEFSVKPRFAGVPLRIASFIFGVFKSIDSTKKRKSRRAADCVIFAHSQNQAVSIAPTAHSLEASGFRLHFVITPSALGFFEPTQESKSENISLSVLDALTVLFLAFIRAPAIWSHLGGSDTSLRHWHFDAFLRCHIYLVFFDRVLESTRPSIVLVSNDHSAPHRCLIGMARAKGIKTAYMQHASVLPNFPALAFDYSLLDGSVALERYRAAESNKPEDFPMPVERHVLLTGQKKPITRADRAISEVVGIAVNPSDSIAHIQLMLQHLVVAGYALRLRWHPGMNEKKKKIIRERYSKSNSVALSDPKCELVSEFFRRCHVLVAGNSSIHLEAAIAGLQPIYYEVTPVEAPDYYGYVLHGLSIGVDDLEELSAVIRVVLDERCMPDEQAVAAYSATFNTEWEGKENELASGILKLVLTKGDPARCWGYCGLVSDTSVSVRQTG